MHQLSPKQTLFVHFYVIGSNATDAAKRAGYSEKTAQQQGSRLLSNVMVSSEISRRRDAIITKLGITQEAILAELHRIAFANMQDYVTTGPCGGDLVIDLRRITRDQGAALQMVMVQKKGAEGNGAGRRMKIRLADKVGALKLLGQALGMFGELKAPVRKDSLTSALLKEIEDNQSNGHIYK